MDTTPKYIKMCSCPEIQGLWKPRWGDFVYDNDGAVFPIATVRIDKDECTWLPRQDQLQEMVFDETVGMQSRCCAIYEFSISIDGYVFTLDDGSLEQLWLAFVMKEKFNKVWDDKKEEWKTFAK